MWMTILGLLVGFLVGLTGVGAAALLTPVLLLLGFHPSVAVGSDLVYNAVTKFFGVIQHARQKTIHYTLVRDVSLGSVPAAVAAILLLHLWPWLARHESSIIHHVLGVALIVVALATLTRVLFDRRLRQNSLQAKSYADKRTLTIAVGAGVGFLVGLTSVGSGALFSALLLYLYTLSPAAVVGTDIAQSFVLTLVAGGLQMTFGHVDYGLVGRLLVGSIPGVLVGSYLSARIPARPLRAVVALIILTSGLHLV